MALNVRIIFPTQATLLENETEKFRISLRGTESNPDVALEILDSVFGYKILRKDIRGGSAIIELGLVPKYNQQNLGESSLTNIELSGTEEILNELLIHDAGLRPRVVAQYHFQLFQKGSAEVIQQGEAHSQQASRGVISVTLTQPLPADVDYIVQISVARGGIVLEKPFSFTVNKEVRFQRWASDDFGRKTLKNLRLNDEESQVAVEFKDDGAHAKLKTLYKVSVLTKDQQELHSAEFLAEQVLDSQKQARLQIPSDVVSREEDLIVVLDVFRKGNRLDRDVHFQERLDRSFVNMADIKDSRKIHSVNLVGLATEMKLVFMDELAKSPKVQTEYHIVIRRHGGFLGFEKKVLMEAQFTDKLVKDGKFNQSLLSLGARAKDLENYAGSDQTLYVELTATRKLVPSKTTAATIKKSVTVKTESTFEY